MSREKDLLNNTFILSLGRVLPQFATFITLPILTGCLSKSEYGTYDLIATLLLVLIPIATLEIQSAAFRFLIECREDQRETNSVITNITAVTVPTSLIVSITIGFCLIGYPTTIRALIAFYFFLDTVTLMLGQIVRGLGKNRAYSIQACLQSLVKMGGIVAFVYYNKFGIQGVFGALTLADLAASVYLMRKIRIFQILKIKDISFSKIKTLLQYSWPMVPNNLSAWVLSLSDRLVITAALGVNANAIYAVANKIPSILAVVQSVLMMAWQENASVASKDEDATAYYSSMLEITYNVMIGFTAVLIACMPVIFHILIRGDYSESYYHTSILILAAFFNIMSGYMSGIYIAHKKTFSIGVTTIAAAGLNLLIDVLCVRYIGIWAGSLSTLFAYVFLYFYRVKNCKKFQPLTIHYKKHVVQIFIILAMVVICSTKNTILLMLNLIIGTTTAIYFNRELLRRAYNIVCRQIRQNTPH